MFKLLKNILEWMTCIYRDQLFTFEGFPPSEIGASFLKWYHQNYFIQPCYDNWGKSICYPHPLMTASRCFVSWLLLGRHTGAIRSDQTTSSDSLSRAMSNCLNGCLYWGCLLIWEIWNIVVKSYNNSSCNLTVLSILFISSWLVTVWPKHFRLSKLMEHNGDTYGPY